jgi:hypothetical protein
MHDRSVANSISRCFSIREELSSGTVALVGHVSVARGTRYWRMEAYHMDIVSKDTCCFDVSQGACSVLWLVMRQEPLVYERVVSSDCKLIGVLEVYATHYLKFLAVHHCVLVILVFDVKHFFVRLHVPVIIVFVFNRGIVKDLSGTDMVVASEATQKKLWLTLLWFRYG